MKTKVLIAVVLVGFSSLWAASPGTVGFSFLRTQVGARAAGMGGAFLAVPGDIHALYYNPAGLFHLNTRSASATYLNHVLDLNSGFIGYAQPVGRWGKAGVSALYVDFGEFKKRDNTGLELGDFGASSLSLAATFAFEPLTHLGVGMSAKAIHTSIDNFSAQAVAVDGGVVYTFPEHELHVAAGFFNLGAALSAFVDEKDDLPFHYRAGFAKKLAHLPLFFSFNLYKYIREEWHGAIGGEFQLSEKFFLRLGYDHLGQEMQVGTSRDRFAGAAIGFGLLLKNVQIDYSLTSHGEIGTLNRFTLSGTL